MSKKEFIDYVDKESQRLKSREGRKGLWHYVVTACSIGWLVVLPALGGAYIGRHIDRWLGTQGYWTMSLMMSGLGVGIYWIWKQNLHKGGD
jgi:ATP synthase protein I